MSDDGLPDRVEAGPWRARLLWGVAAVESVTLAILISNLVTGGHSNHLAAAVGPVHGSVYLAGVLLSWLSPLRRPFKIIAVVPVIGVWVAVILLHRLRARTRLPGPGRDGTASARTPSAPAR